MFLQRTNIRLGVCDAGRSAAFYEALLGAAPSYRTATGAVFELDSPPLVLTVEERPARERGARLAAARAPPRRDRGRQGSKRRLDPAPERRVTTGFALLVDQPRGVGDAAIALRRAGVRLRLEDAGIEACDPDGNPWRVRFVGSVNGRSVVAGEASER